MGFLRMYGHEFLGLLIFIAVILIIAKIIIKYIPMEKEVKKIIDKVKWAIILLSVVVFAIYFIPSLAVNYTPRGVIDRSQVIQDQQKYENRILKQGEKE